MARALPEGDLSQMAQVGMNPLTALVILTEFKTLKAGDWVISTAANSAVGRSVIPIAKARGIKTVNIVRAPNLFDEIKAIGGDVVIANGPDLVKQIREATEGANIQLALDGVGGPLTQQLIEAIGLYGTVVLWSRMGGVDPTIATIPVLFTGKSLHGVLDRELVEDTQESRTINCSIRRDCATRSGGQDRYPGRWRVRA